MCIIEGRVEDITSWPTWLETLITRIDGCCVNRVIVLESTLSTMDAAKTYAGDQPGVLVVASNQIQGRGQRGRKWFDSDGCTLPCTFLIDSRSASMGLLSVLVGCAVHETIRSFIPASCEALIKWPNDIVIRDGEIPHESDRKIAGILIEQDGNIAKIGIGINCAQGRSDWDQSISQHAVSISELGMQVSRLEVLSCLIDRLSYWLNESDSGLIESYYQSHDAMVHTRRQFVHQNTVYKGIVEGINPLDVIVVRTQDGRVHLPAAMTHHAHESDE